jgi:hypothetical protein
MDSRVVGSVESGGQLYCPPRLSVSLQQAMLFPVGMRDFASTTALFTAVKDSLLHHGLPEDVALSATYFIFSSWFSEVLPAAPFLLISGPRPEANLLLQLLGCLVRHPLPLVEISASNLRSLPMQLRPTPLVDNELVRDSLLRLLSVSSNRSANILLKDGVVNTYSAKVLYQGTGAGDDSFGDAVMHINLALSDRMLPILNQKHRQDLAAEFQPGLLAYRVKNIARVAAAQCTFPGLPRQCQLLASLLAVCIVDAPELQAGVGSLLEVGHQQTRADRWGDLQCVVIEAILSCCHRRQNEGDIVYVGDIAADAAAILSGRGETTKLEPRAIGSILRDLGLNGKRDSRGYRFVLDDPFCDRIHRLAQQFDVATIQEGGLATCADCRGNHLASSAWA